MIYHTKKLNPPVSIKGSQKTDEKANKKLNMIPLLDAVGDQIEARFRPLLCFNGGRRNIISLSWEAIVLF